MLISFLVSAQLWAMPVEKPVKISKSVLIVADSLSANSRFAYHMRDFFENPEGQCGQSVTANNEVNYYSRVSSSPRHWGDD